MRQVTTTYCIQQAKSTNNTIGNRPVRSKGAPEKAAPAITIMRQATTTYYTQQAGATGRGQKGSPTYSKWYSEHNSGRVYDTGATGRKGSPTYSKWYSDAAAPGRGQESSTTTIKPQAEVDTECYPTQGTATSGSVEGTATKADITDEYQNTKLKRIYTRASSIYRSVGQEHLRRVPPERAIL